MIEERQTFDLLTHLFREEGFDGWVAHVLPLDVVTHGKSLREALAMAEEAASMVMVEDWNAGLSPWDRRAPQEDFDRAMASVTKSAAPPEPMELSYVVQNEASFRSVVVTVPATIVHVVADDQPQHQPLAPPNEEMRSVVVQAQRCA